MTKLTKKQKGLDGKVEANKLYPVADAIGLVKSLATAMVPEAKKAAGRVNSPSTINSPATVSMIPA